MNKGHFYNRLTEERKDDAALKACIEETVADLLSSDTSLRKPGILLGKIQSGKTRAFIGVIALAFDNGYDIAVVLTKGTKALSEQTLKRLKESNGGFGTFEDENNLQIHDVMTFPDNLPQYVLSQKLILVSKKEDDNLRRLLKFMTETYPTMQKKKILIIDDEADFASISFKKGKESGLVEQGKIASQIDEIRTKIEKSDFLQVTATPYSLYLQPSDEDGDTSLFLPKRPAFTKLLPIHDDYVGGDYYFLQSEDENSPASCVYKELPVEESEVLNVGKKLKRADRRSFRIEEVFTSPITKVLRKSIINFIVGGCVRRIQQKEKPENYSLVIHTDIHTISHAWQEEVIKKLNDELINLSRNNLDLFSELVKEAYNDLKVSVELSGFQIPPFGEVVTEVIQALIGGMLFVQRVNSERDVNALLDSKGQLKLWAPLNIFIGGQILDRGITIKNMIGFYYGRNPKKFQQDTVLQHSRMYGARSKKDLAVTRFYTTREIYEIMQRIHEFDNALRKAFLDGSHQHGVYFIRKDTSDRLVPCSPNKLLLSRVTTLRPFGRLLPTGFDTDYKTNIKKTLEELDSVIDGFFQGRDSGKPVLINLGDAILILEKINSMFIFKEHYSWDLKSHKAALEFLSKASTDDTEKCKVWVMVRKGRDTQRERSDDRVPDSPDTSTGDRALAHQTAIDTPMLMLFRQNGKEEKGWRGSPFWWPVILPQQNTHTTIFAGETAK